MIRLTSLTATLLAILLMEASGAAESPGEGRGAILLKDVTRETGITFVHTDGSSGQYYIVENVCCGLALFDYNNDGKIDIYFLTGGNLKGTHYTPPPQCRLYRNEGHWRFTDVTQQSGLGNAGRHALGVAVGDYDNDGFQDVYVTHFGPNVLYHNNGDGTFTDVTQKAGVAGRGGVAQGPTSWMSTATGSWTCLLEAMSTSRMRTTSPGPSRDTPCTQVRGPTSRPPTCCSTTTGTARSRR